jgi:hypothetical protein
VDQAWSDEPLLVPLLPPVGDRQQEIVLIGVHMDAAAAKAALGACLVTDAEYLTYLVATEKSAAAVCGIVGASGSVPAAAAAAAGTVVGSAGADSDGAPAAAGGICSAGVPASAAGGRSSASRKRKAGSESAACGSVRSAGHARTPKEARKRARLALSAPEWAGDWGFDEDDEEEGGEDADHGNEREGVNAGNGSGGAGRQGRD